MTHIPELPEKEVATEEFEHEKAENIIITMKHRPTGIKVAGTAKKIAKEALVHSLKRKLDQKVFRLRIS